MLLWQTWLLFWEDYGKTLELWTRNAMECSKLSELYCGSMEDYRVLRKRQMLEAWVVKVWREVWESLKDYQGCCVFSVKHLWFWSAVLNKRPEPLKLFLTCGSQPQDQMTLSQGPHIRYYDIFDISCILDTYITIYNNSRISYEVSTK